MNNEKGIALVTVLLTILVSMLLLGTLASIILSTAEQTQRSQENIQADSLAMMGHDYITSSFESAKEEAEYVAMNEEGTIEAYIEEWAQDHTSTDRSLGEGKYTVKVPEKPEINEEGTVVYSYISTGFVGGQEETIRGKLIVEQEVVEEDWKNEIINEKEDMEGSSSFEKVDICEPRNQWKNDSEWWIKLIAWLIWLSQNDWSYESSDYEWAEKRNDAHLEAGDYVIESADCAGGAKNDLFFEEESRVWFKESLTMKGSNNFVINGFAYFELSKLYMNGTNTIEVYGDAYIDAADFHVTDIKMNKKAKILIHGNLYIEGADREILDELNICVDGNKNVESISKCQEG